MDPFDSTEIIWQRGRSEMKRSTKALLMAALCFAITGGAFCIVSICTGFTVERFQNAVNDGDFILIGSQDAAKEVNSFVTDISGDNVDMEQTYRDIDSLKLQAGAAKCQIILWDEEEWKVKGINMPASFSAKKSGGWLKVSCTYSGMKFWENRSDTVMEIYVPKDVVLSEVELESGVGEISIEDGFLICENLELECGVGECDIYADVKREAKIEGGVGAVQLTLVGKEEDYDFDLECGLGSIKIGDDEFEGAGVERRIDNEAERGISVECGIGSVEIVFEE